MRIIVARFLMSFLTMLAISGCAHRPVGPVISTAEACVTYCKSYGLRAYGFYYAGKGESYCAHFSCECAK
jgi:hypothetical protein